MSHVSDCCPATSRRGQHKAWLRSTKGNAYALDHVDEGPVFLLGSAARLAETNDHCCLANDGNPRLSNRPLGS